MPRLLNNAPCSITFYDKISDSKITLFYRLPTTDERIKYANSGISRKGNKIESTIGENRIDYGEKILTGFKEGAFEKSPGVLLSSDPKSSNYDENWKTIVKNYAADVLAALAVFVFEGSLVADEPDAPANPS
jgi:hypothetical protein